MDMLHFVPRRFEFLVFVLQELHDKYAVFVQLYMKCTQHS